MDLVEEEVSSQWFLHLLIPPSLLTPHSFPAVFHRIHPQILQLNQSNHRLPSTLNRSYFSLIDHVGQAASRTFANL